MNYQLYDRILGCLTGAAIGDSMGVPLETRTIDMVKRDYGDGGFIFDYKTPLPDSLAHGLPKGLVTDDFSCAYVTAQHYLNNGGQVTEESSIAALLEWAESPTTKVFYDRYCGPSTKAGLMRLRGQTDISKQARTCNSRCATNGAGMKGWIVGTFHPDDIDKAIDDVITMCMPTHDNVVSLSGAAAIVAAISHALTKNSNTGSIVEAGLYGAREGYKRAMKSARICAGASVEERIRLAVGIGLKHATDFEACVREMTEVVGVGLSANESIPSAFGYFVSSGGDVMQSIFHAVNSGNDSDTTGVVAGSIAGAFQGIKMIPRRHLPFLEQVNQMQIADLARRISALSEQRLS